MRKLLKRVMAAVVVAALAAGVVVAPAMADEAHAATKPYMKTLKLKWDLKKNKTLKITEPWAGIGKQPATVTLKNFKITKAKKEGYKKLTYKVVIKRTWNPTKSKVHKLVNNNYWWETESFGGGVWGAQVDYKTGQNLEAENDFGVTVKTGGWKHSNYKKAKDWHGCWVKYPRTISATVTITYPEDYKGLCIGIGGSNLKQSTKADDAFWQGAKKFGKTSYYKKGKANSHWMRVK